MYHRSGPGWNPPEPGPGEPWRGSEHTEGWPEEMAGRSIGPTESATRWNAQSSSWSESAPHATAASPFRSTLCWKM